MSDKCFVDTNVLVYGHDRSAGVKHKAAQRSSKSYGTLAEVY